MNPSHILGLKVWANGLASQAIRKQRDAADRLYGEAEEKLLLAVSLAPDDTDLMCRLGHMRLRRAMLSANGKSAESLVQARRFLETVLRQRPTSSPARILWAHALSEQS